MKKEQQVSKDKIQYFQKKAREISKFRRMPKKSGKELKGIIIASYLVPFQLVGMAIIIYIVHIFKRTIKNTFWLFKRGGGAWRV